VPAFKTAADYLAFSAARYLRINGERQLISASSD
jgi:hypothetical protein